MPGDTIKSAIKRGTGEIEGPTYDEVLYEGTGSARHALPRRRHDRQPEPHRRRDPEDLREEQRQPRRRRHRALGLRSQGAHHAREGRRDRGPAHGSRGRRRRRRLLRRRRGVDGHDAARGAPGRARRARGGEDRREGLAARVRPEDQEAGHRSRRRGAHQPRRGRSTITTTCRTSTPTSTSPTKSSRSSRERRASPLGVTVLGLDPGTRHFGWGVVRRVGTRLTHVAHGVISVEGDGPLGERLVAIETRSSRSLAKYLPARGERRVDVLREGRARPRRSSVTRAASALLVRARAGLAVFEYPPARVKRTVAGAGRADKAQVAHMIRVMLGAAEPRRRRRRRRARDRRDAPPGPRSAGRRECPFPGLPRTAERPCRDAATAILEGAGTSKGIETRRATLAL